MRKPDITEIIEREGFTLKNNKMKCPFHEEKTASFIVFPLQQSFYCFGCGSGGDVISFIQKLHGMIFLQAAEYLRMESPRTCKRDIQRRQAIETYKQWEKDYYTDLCIQYRTIQNHKRLVQDIDAISQEAYHAEIGIEYRMDILMYGDNQTKLALWREVTGGKW